MVNTALCFGVPSAVCLVVFNAMARVIWKKYGKFSSHYCITVGYLLRGGSGMVGILAPVFLPLTVYNMVPVSGILMTQLMSRIILKDHISPKQYVYAIIICFAICGSIFCANFEDESETVFTLHQPCKYLFLSSQLLVTSCFTIVTLTSDSSFPYFQFVSAFLLATETTISDVYWKLISPVLTSSLFIIAPISIWFLFALFFLYVEQYIMKNSHVVTTIILVVMFRVLLKFANGLVIFESTLKYPGAYIFCMSVVLTTLAAYFRDANPKSESNPDIILYKKVEND